MTQFFTEWRNRRRSRRNQPLPTALVAPPSLTVSAELRRSLDEWRTHNWLERAGMSA